MSLPLFEERPDASLIDYTLVIPHDAVCELIRGVVPHDVLVVCISSVKAMHETPAGFVEATAQKRRQRTRKAGAA